MVVLQQRHVKNVTIMAKSMHKTSQGSAERDLPYQLQPNLLDNSQIHARNLKVRRKGICHTSLVLKIIWTWIDIVVGDA